MNRIQSLSNTLAGRTALVAGSALVGNGVVQIVHTQRHTSRVVGVAGHLSLAFVIVALLTMWPAYLALSRSASGRLPWHAALAVTAGVVGLGLTCVYSLFAGRDLAVFPFLAGPANAAWLIGSLVLAVTLKRAGRVPTPLAVTLPLVWLFSILGAGFGGGLISGGYLLVLGYLLSADAIERPAERRLTGVAA